jgi:hypothetical protein
MCAIATKRETAMAKRSVSQPPVAQARQRSRETKAPITFWVDPIVRQQLRVLALQSDQTVQALLDAAIELLFRERGRPRIVPGRTA